MAVGGASLVPLKHAPERGRTCDVLIVGAGTSGMVAAVAAALKGARVIVIEKNDYVGGEGLVSMCTANLGGGTDYQKALGVEETPEDFFEDMRRWDPKADPRVLKAFCDTSVQTCHFLRDLGVPWSLDSPLAAFASTADMGMNVRRAHSVVGRGPAFYAALTPHLSRAGGIVLTGTKALELLTDDRGAVSGILARDGEGSFVIAASCTMLACGGFEGNAELVTRYISPEANYALLRGLPTNSGDGLLMGLQVGAGTRALHRIHGYLHLPPCPLVYPLHPFSMIPRDGSATLPPFVQAFPHGLMVNLRGERFADETMPRIGENICNALVKQPGSLGFAVMDGPLFERHWKGVVEETSAFWRGVGLGPVRVECDDTLEGLAARMEVNPRRFAAMVGEYNEAVDAGTTHLLPIPKSNRDPLGYYAKQDIDFLQKIAEPPFHAVLTIAGLSHTNGGLTIDERCRVLDRDGGVIVGLHAGGDTSVLWHGNYGSAYARALVTGYIAGTHMAKA